MIYQIKNILNIEHYKITCLWNTGEVRVIDLEKKLNEWGDHDKSVYRKLLNEQLFKTVKCDGTTLYWEGLATVIETDGTKHPAPLDLDPQTLFEQSKKVN